MIEIDEVLRRSSQGMTKPYICRGSDGEIYFVKGVGAGRDSLIKEFLAGHLALELELPIAPFEVVSVPSELIDANPKLTADLGAGLAFGSRQSRVSEIVYSAIESVPESIQRAVFAFDWWIMNGDRILTELGGNPNLFLEPKNQEVVIIDHNLAFDKNIDLAELLENHVFRGAGHQILGDWDLRLEFSNRFTEALQCFEDIAASLPVEWTYLDPEQTVPVEFNAVEALEIISKCQLESFWD